MCRWSSGTARSGSKRSSRRSGSRAAVFIEASPGWSPEPAITRRRSVRETVIFELKACDASGAGPHRWHTRTPPASQNRRRQSGIRLRRGRPTTEPRRPVQEYAGHGNRAGNGASVAGLDGRSNQSVLTEPDGSPPRCRASRRRYSSSNDCQQRPAVPPPHSVGRLRTLHSYPSGDGK